MVAQVRKSVAILSLRTSSASIPESSGDCDFFAQASAHHFATRMHLRFFARGIRPPLCREYAPAIFRSRHPLSTSPLDVTSDFSLATPARTFACDATSDFSQVAKYTRDWRIPSDPTARSPPRTPEFTENLIKPIENCTFPQKGSPQMPQNLIKSEEMMYSG